MINTEQNGKTCLLKLPAMAAYINMSESWVKQHPDAIPYVRIGTKSKRWRIQDLDEFIGKQLQGKRS
jgi:predicted DNA-binding transcriptional regulator AlpA